MGCGRLHDARVVLMLSGTPGGSIWVKSPHTWGFALALGLGLGSGLPLSARAQTDLLPVGVVEGSRVEGTILGAVVDESEAAVPDAAVRLEARGLDVTRTVRTAEDGSFVLTAVRPGEYGVVVTREGFAEWHGAATLGSDGRLRMPAIVMKVVSASTAVEVRASTREIAEAQLQLEEKQRVLGVFPNFYASYAPDAEPLSAGQKFQLAWRFAVDPVAFAMTGVVASSEQRANTFPAYGRGVSGYSKRYSAAYADGLTSTLLGQALLPAVFHQDPRYFVKGTGSVGSRVLYAMASMVICKGDNRRWQPNYSNVLGNFAAASLSNVYYPAASRGGSLIVQNAVMATAMGAVGGLFQEFLLHRMTPHVPDYEAVR